MSFSVCFHQCGFSRAICCWRIFTLHHYLQYYISLTLFSWSSYCSIAQFMLIVVYSVIPVFLFRTQIHAHLPASLSFSSFISHRWNLLPSSNLPAHSSAIPSSISPPAQPLSHSPHLSSKTALPALSASSLLNSKLLECWWRKVMVDQNGGRNGPEATDEDWSSSNSAGF